jgi:hypothetical protein
LEPPYSTIDDLTEKRSVIEASELLKHGWVLIKASELLGIDQQSHQITTLTYILGHVKENKRKPRDSATAQASTQSGSGSNNQQAPQQSPATQQPPPATPQPPNIISLPIQWRRKNEQNPNFYYAFVNTLEGKPDPVVEPVVKAISTSGGAIVQEGWRFTVKNQFLQRSKVKSV